MQTASRKEGVPKQVMYLPPSADEIRRLAFKTSHKMDLTDVKDKQEFAGFLKALMVAYASKRTREHNQGAVTWPSCV